MYIRRVHIKDVRGIRQVAIDLRRPNENYAGWTVLAGRNGSGKSTFLKAIALAVVGPNALRGLQRSFVGWIREGEEGAIASAELVIDEADQFSSGADDVPRECIWTGLSWIRLNSGYEPALAALSDDRNHQLSSPIQERGPWATNPIGWFMVGYGPYRRLSGIGSDAQGPMQGPPSVARLSNLFREGASLIESVQWLKSA